MYSLFNRFFDMDFPISRRLFKDGNWAPRVDVVEGKGDITVKADIPGCEAKDIDVKLECRTLTITGEKNQEKEEKDENILKEQREKDRREETCEGYCYISTVGWICRRERFRRKNLAWPQ